MRIGSAMTADLALEIDRPAELPGKFLSSRL